MRDVVCTSGPDDSRFEELNSNYSIAVVASGTFQYEVEGEREVMTPGSLMLGSYGQCYECGHDHGAGDRCVSFTYTPAFFEQIAAGAGVPGWEGGFGALRVPAIRPTAGLVTRACAGLLLNGSSTDPRVWEELSVEMAALALQLSTDRPAVSGATLSAEARVTRVARAIEAGVGRDLSLESLAQEAKLSPYHFLRVFQQVTGLTPHQYVLRSRLREAALRLQSGTHKVLDVALDCGFGDVSNFNRAFRAEFGSSPRAYRQGSREV